MDAKAWQNYRLKFIVAVQKSNSAYASNFMYKLFTPQPNSLTLF